MPEFPPSLLLSSLLRDGPPALPPLSASRDLLSEARTVARSYKAKNHRIKKEMKRLRALNQSLKADQLQHGPSSGMDHADASVFFLSFELWRLLSCSADF